MDHKPNRIYYTGINAWRAALLLFGVVVHAFGLFPTGIAHTLIGPIGLVSHLFRMEAFFAISGFLTWNGYAKAGQTYCRNRIAQLSLPLLTSYFIILPLGLHFARLRYGAVSPSDLAHLWFLVVLIGLVICIDEIERKTNLVDTLADYLIRRPISTTIIVIVYSAATVISASVISKSLDMDPYFIESHSFLSAVARIPYFFTYFVLGFTIAKSGAITVRSSIFIKIGLAGLINATLIVAVYARYPYMFYGVDRSILIKATAQSIVPLVGVPVSILILTTGYKTTIKNSFANMLSRSSMTIYLCHLTVVLAAYIVSVHLNLDENAALVFVIANGIGVPLLFHVMAVENSRYLRILVNGSFALPNADRRGLKGLGNS